MSRDKPAKARRDAQKDMRREGFSTGPCRHRNTQTTYEYDGKGTEHCTKFWALGHTVHPGERNARCGALTTNGALRHLRQATTWGVGGLWCRRRSPAGASTGPDESGPPTPHLSRVPVQLELPISHARFVATISIKESSILAARVVLAPYGTCVISSFPTFALNAMSRACCIVK